MNANKTRLFLLCSLFAVNSLLLSAGDFGLNLDQTPASGGSGDDASFEYTGILIPRYTAFLGDNLELYLSLGLRLDYKDSAAFIPELFRTELTLRFSSGDFTAGRMQYTDPLGFVADGLFDGARLSLDTSAGTFSAGAWYTGFLFKNRAEITMTSQELEDYYADISYDDFSGTYFAPRRAFAALDWSSPAIANLFRLKAGLLGQLDLSGADLHPQYLTANAAMPLRDFVFELGGCLELIEKPKTDTSSAELRLGLAGELGLAWMLPTRLEDSLSFLGRFSSAVVPGDIDAFQPITSAHHGNILKAKLSRLSMLSLDYTARLHQTLSASLTSSYFVRGDLSASVGGYEGPAGYFLGNEFFARLLWSPFSDLQLNLGGGLFLPSLGNVAPDAKSAWRVELNIILALS
jgi:hypothetical protein